MSHYPKLEILKEKIDNYHPIVKIVFNILNDTNRIYLMKKSGSYTLNDTSSSSFLIGDDKIALLVEFIENLQEAFVNKQTINFRIGKIEKNKLEDFNDKVINSQPLNDSYVQELMQVLPYYVTPYVFITTVLKDYLPKANQIQKSIFSKLGMSQEPDPVVPTSLNIEKIIVNALKNAPINKTYSEEAESIKKLFTMFCEKNSFLKKHVSENVLTQSIINYTQERVEVFENLKDKNLEQGLFKSIKEIIPKDHWRDFTNHLSSYPKKNIDSQSMFEIEDIITIQVKINKGTIYNKYNDINTEDELNRMICTVVEVLNKNKSQEIESIVLKNVASENHASLFISGKSMNKDFAMKVLQGLNNLIEDYDSLEMGIQVPFDAKWEKNIEYLKKLSHAFWINLKINEVKESSPERTKVRKI